MAGFSPEATRLIHRHQHLRESPPHQSQFLPGGTPSADPTALPGGRLWRRKLSCAGRPKPEMQTCLGGWWGPRRLKGLAREERKPDQRESYGKKVQEF